MRFRVLIMLMILSLTAAAQSAEARIQDDFMCWVPDCEFPVDCDGEE